MSYKNDLNLSRMFPIRLSYEMVRSAIDHKPTPLPSRALDNPSFEGDVKLGER